MHAFTHDSEPHGRLLGSFSTEREVQLGKSVFLSKMGTNQFCCQKCNSPTHGVSKKWQVPENGWKGMQQRVQPLITRFCDCAQQPQIHDKGHPQLTETDQATPAGEPGQANSKKGKNGYTMRKDAEVESTW